MLFLFTLLAVLFCSKIRAHTAVVAGHAISRNEMEPTWNIPRDSKMRNNHFNDWNSIFTYNIDCNSADLSYSSWFARQYKSLGILS